MPDTTLTDAELLLKEMQTASSFEVHWRTYCDKNRERIMATFLALYEFAELCDQTKKKEA